MFPGIFLLAKYRDAGPALAWIAVFFLTIVLASIAAAGAGATLPRAKLLLLIQCLLPTFGLALGAMFAAHRDAAKNLSTGLLWVLLLVVPVQLVHSWAQHSLSLLHHVAFFDVYQHLQYVPTVLVCGYLVVLGERWGSSLNRASLGTLGIACAMYVAGSYALLAIVFLVFGVTLISLQDLRVRRALALPGLAVAVLGSAAIYVHATSETEIFLDKYGGMPERTALACVAGGVARASVLVQEMNDTCVVRGEPRALSAPILRARPITASGLETFRVEGELKEGRIMIGLRQDANWVATRIVDAPGQFAAEFRPKPGTYEGAIFNSDNRARYIDLSISRIAWLLPDGKSVDAAQPGNPLQRPSVAVTRGDAEATAKTNGTYEKLPTNWRERFEDWFMYARRVVSEPRVVLVGAAAPHDRSVRTSAHNCFIDFLYNFGVVGLSPIFVLIAYTVFQLLRKRRRIWPDRSLFALCIAVVLAALVGSLFKVTLRQPYSGITAFFLWGVLLHSLRRTEPPERITG
jgi:O-antigen ligase